MGVEIKELIVRAVVNTQSAERSAGSGRHDLPPQENNAVQSTSQRLRKPGNTANER